MSESEKPFLRDLRKTIAAMNNLLDNVIKNI